MNIQTAIKELTIYMSGYKYYTGFKATKSNIKNYAFYPQDNLEDLTYIWSVLGAEASMSFSFDQDTEGVYHFSIRVLNDPLCTAYSEDFCHAATIATALTVRKYFNE